MIWPHSPPFPTLTLPTLPCHLVLSSRLSERVRPAKHRSCDAHAFFLGIRPSTDRDRMDARADAVADELDDMLDGLDEPTEGAVRRRAETQRLPLGTPRQCRQATRPAAAAAGHPPSGELGWRAGSRPGSRRGSRRRGAGTAIATTTTTTTSTTRISAGTAATSTSAKAGRRTSATTATAPPGRTPRPGRAGMTRRIASTAKETAMLERSGAN